ncbi:hypothetical protein LZ480_18305 [Solibacillus sp. MA9]|uniref:Uncharacterized protein n=1 Tax=Solibacillus palustris TaxID=2908203 RepID=A0ABS9UHI8_9BACL|nr:hypothetical protein [Solibacillus sp. MA9]MCH7323826.1 hypothetical protein [Solibacillus sp. MA9]
MKANILRVGAIFVIGMFVYFYQYEKDELGLAIIFAFINSFIVTIFVAIPIIFMNNPLSFSKKFGLYVLSVVLTMTPAFLGVGHLKTNVENKLDQRAIQNIAQTYQVELADNAVALSFGEFLFVNDGNPSFTVYNKLGQKQQQWQANELAKAVSVHLPLTDAQKVTTYFDGFTTQPMHHHLFRPDDEQLMYFEFRYVTSEAPQKKNPDVEIHDGAKNIQYHYIIRYKPTLDAVGQLQFTEANFEQLDYLVSYQSPGIESIVAPNTARLISEL